MKVEKILKDASYMIVVKEKGDWTVVDAKTGKEWKKTELKEFQGKQSTVPGKTRRVFVEYDINPRLVCIGNYCRYI